jgi:hypothetical protein
MQPRQEPAQDRIPAPSPTLPQDEKTADFDDLPALDVFLRHGGVPGVEYAHVLAKNVGDAQDIEGLEFVAGLRKSYRVRGLSCILMCRGDPIPGASPHGSEPLVFVDPELDDLLGAAAKAEAEAEAAEMPAPFDRAAHQTVVPVEVTVDGAGPVPEPPPVPVGTAVDAGPVETTAEGEHAWGVEQDTGESDDDLDAVPNNEGDGD